MSISVTYGNAAAIRSQTENLFIPKKALALHQLEKYKRLSESAQTEEGRTFAKKEFSKLLYLYTR